jgi:hypothetical protein
MKNILPIRFGLLFLFCLTTSAFYAQKAAPGTGKAVIYFEPSTKVIVRLDSALLKQSKLPINLKEGRHIVRAWAPTKELFIDTIDIRASKTTLVARRLKNSEAYAKYKEELFAYRFKKTVTAFVPLPLTLGYSIFLAGEYSNNKKLMNQHLVNATADAANYAKPGSASDLNTYKLEYDNERNNYESCRTKNNRIVVVGAVTVSAALVASAVLLYLSAKYVKPAVYTETPMLSLNSINLKSDYPATCSLSISWNIKRYTGNRFKRNQL